MNGNIEMNETARTLHKAAQLVPGWSVQGDVTSLCYARGAEAAMAELAPLAGHEGAAGVGVVCLKDDTGERRVMCQQLVGGEGVQWVFGSPGLGGGETYHDHLDLAQALAWACAIFWEPEPEPERE